VTIAPQTHTIGNCYPFGGGTDTDPTSSWEPYMGFVYKNVPAFQLKTGDSLAFDLGAMNDVNIQLEIALAATSVNGGDVPAQPFTTVVTNTQTPANPRGDTTVGNFELSFTAQAPFSFPGGGLIIRFVNPSPSFAPDMNCDAVLVRTTSSDPSNNFVERFFRDADGTAPYDDGDFASIGGFRVTLADVPPVKKKKCKKHKKHAASIAKKHCKKKKK
jgi:hypothetical protein